MDIAEFQADAVSYILQSLHCMSRISLPSHNSEEGNPDMSSVTIAQIPSMLLMSHRAADSPMLDL